jgi:predicted outer membrane repeat protein
MKHYGRLLIVLVLMVAALTFIQGGYCKTITMGSGISTSSNSISSSSGYVQADNIGTTMAGIHVGPGITDLDWHPFIDDGMHHVQLDLQIGHADSFILTYAPPDDKQGNIPLTNGVALNAHVRIGDADKIIARAYAEIYPKSKPSKNSLVNIEVDKTGGTLADFDGTIVAIANEDTQATLNGHVDGALKSNGQANNGKTLLYEQASSNGALIKADLNLKAVTGIISVRGAGTFSVDDKWGGKIQDAVNAAWDGDTIKVNAGTYVENVHIDKSLTLEGAAKGETLIDGNKAGSVFTIGKSNPKVDVILKDITITNGLATSGGGIYNCGTLTLNDVLVTQNTAKNYGGGIYNTGAMNIYAGSSISDNVAKSGGGIYNNRGTVTFMDKQGNPIDSYNTVQDPSGFFGSGNTPDNYYSR